MRADRLRDEHNIRISTTHFPLHPETPPEGVSLEQLFAGRNVDLAASQTRLQRILEEEGQPYGERRMTYNSRLAQELSKWAETQPAGEGKKLHGQAAQPVVERAPVEIAVR